VLTLIILVPDALACGVLNCDFGCEVICVVDFGRNLDFRRSRNSLSFIVETAIEEWQQSCLGIAGYAIGESTIEQLRPGPLG